MIVRASRTMVADWAIGTPGLIAQTTDCQAAVEVREQRRQDVVRGPLQHDAIVSRHFAQQLGHRRVPQT